MESNVAINKRLLDFVERHLGPADNTCVSYWTWGEDTLPKVRIYTLPMGQNILGWGSKVDGLNQIDFKTERDLQKRVYDLLTPAGRQKWDTEGWPSIDGEKTIKTFSREDCVAFLSCFFGKPEELDWAWAQWTFGTQKGFRIYSNEWRLGGCHGWVWTSSTTHFNTFDLAATLAAVKDIVPDVKEKWDKNGFPELINLEHRPEGILVEYRYPNTGEIVRQYSLVPDTCFKTVNYRPTQTVYPVAQQVQKQEESTVAASAETKQPEVEPKATENDEAMSNGLTHTKDAVMSALKDAGERNGFRAAAAVIEEIAKRKLGAKYPEWMKDEKYRALTWLLIGSAVTTLVGSGAVNIPHSDKLNAVAELAIYTSADDGMKAAVEELLPVLMTIWDEVQGSPEVSALLTASKAEKVSEFNRTNGVETPIHAPAHVRS